MVLPKAPVTSAGGSIQHLEVAPGHLAQRVGQRSPPGRRDSALTASAISRAATTSSSRRPRGSGRLMKSMRGSRDGPRIVRMRDLTIGPRLYRPEGRARSDGCPRRASAGRLLYSGPREASSHSRSLRPSARRHRCAIHRHDAGPTYRRHPHQRARQKGRPARGRVRHPLPAGDEGDPQGGHAARRSAHHPVRGGGGRRLRHRADHHRHRHRPQRHRGSLRRQPEPGALARGAGRHRDAARRAAHHRDRSRSPSSTRRSSWAWATRC